MRSLPVAVHPNTATRLTAWLRFCFVLIAGLIGTAQAATYTYRSDSFAWESAANVVVWDRSCTSFQNDDDRATIAFTGGFTFTFAGTKYPSVRVLTNGMLQFGADTGLHRTYTNTNLPAGNNAASGACVGGAASNALMAYWADLDPGRAGSGNVTWEQKGSAPNRYVVVSWNSVFQYNTSTPYAFQVILYENGEFKYQYGNDNASGSNATIGVQVGSTDYTLYAYNSGYNANGSAIRWFIPTGEAKRQAEYRFDEYAWKGTLGEVADSSGNGLGGVRVGAATNVDTGKVCRALDVPANTTATTAGVDTTVNVGSRLGSGGSVSFWYRGATAWGTGNDLQLFDASLSSGRSFHLVRRGNGSLRFAVTDSGDSSKTADSPNLVYPATTWVHITATWRLAAGSNQSVLRLYVNGAQVAITTTTTTGALSPTLGNLFIGDNRAGITSNNATVNSANGSFDEFRISNYELSPAEILLDIAQSHSCAPPLHHLELRHASGLGVTCAPDTLTVVACQDAACTTTYTGGLVGTLGSSQLTTLWPSTSAFTIPAGSSSTTVSVQQPEAGSAVLGVAASVPAAPNAATCNFGSPGCTYTAQDAGLLASVSDHVAGTVQTLSLRAVRKADNSTACVAALANVTRALTLRCGYVNPSTGTLPLQVASRSLNASNNSVGACDASGQLVNLAFDALGSASTTLSYADAGQVDLSLALLGGAATGDTGLSLSGSSRFIAAPASFAIDGLPTAAIRAGSAFSARVRALNSAGAVMPNFGREAAPATVSLTQRRSQPTGSGAQDGVFSGGLGAFSAGAASASALAWSEVGRIDLLARHDNYLGSSFSVVGTATSVGPFVPHHFDLTATPACGAFSYAGQPFTVGITARNASGGLTRNYDGSTLTSPNFARATTLATVGGNASASVGSGGFTLDRFKAGSASVTQASVTFTDKLTAPQTALLRVTDSDGVSSAGYAEPNMPLRSGRLVLSNAFGDNRSTLAVPLQLQYWSGRSWVPNTADVCTVLPATAVVRGATVDHKGATANWTTAVAGIDLSSGAGTLRLSAPSPAGAGTVELALNLGSVAVDASCQGTHPASVGAGLPWLRSRNGSCATGFDRDPSARATFGVYAPETRKAVYNRAVD